MASAADQTGGTPSQSTVDNKILADLDVLTEKLDLCDSMLRPGGGDPAPSVRKDEALLSVIGFLEACAPRMVELVEAAAQGALGENVLMKCLEVNDRLTKTLSDINTVALIETPASTTAASATPKNPLDDLLMSDESSGHTPTTGPVGGGKTTGEEDLFQSVGNTAATGNDAVPASKSEDDFDSFFNERTSGPPK